MAKAGPLHFTPGKETDSTGDHVPITYKCCCFCRRHEGIAPASLPLGHSFWHPLNGRLGGTSEPVTTFSKTEGVSYVCHESIYDHSIAVTTLTELSRL